MAGRKRTPGPWDEALKGLTEDQLRELAGQVIDLASRRPVPVSRKHSRRTAPVTYQVRMELQYAVPPVWRVVELSSDLRLDQVHDAVQAAFGWQDYHLHRFALGGLWEHSAEQFLCAAELAEGDAEGEPETGVRLDELLADVGDAADYAYDYGDSWELVLRLEAVAPGVGAPRVVAAHGVAPPEDCGGIGAWNEGRDDQVVETGPLQEALDRVTAEWALPLVVRQVLQRLTSHPTYREVLGLVETAALDRPVDLAAAATSLRRYAWLLDRVGDGIALTQAGYLPPAHVAAAFTELDLGKEWIGKGNREDMTRPVLHLRQSAQRLGLLRVSKGRLLPTKAGTAASRDPLVLASTVAGKAGAVKRSEFRRELAALCWLVVAAGRSIDAEPSRALIVRALADLGWSQDGAPLEMWGLLWRDEDTRSLLEATECLDWRGATPPSAGAQDLARAVLHALV